MENSVFDNLLTDNEVDTTEDDEQQDFDHSFDLTEDDLTSSEDNEQNVNEEATQEDSNDANEGASNILDNPTNAAFAQMRTQNKEYQTKLNELDALAKELGMKDTDDLIAKVKDAQIKKKAASQGMPVEVAKELQELRELKESIVAEREENQVKQREQTFVSNLQEFVNSNKLSKTAIDKLSQDLEKDGFSVESLMAMPKGALNKVLSSYIDTKYQQTLERKNTIRKELPINQSSKIDTELLNKEIDALAKKLAGKN